MINELDLSFYSDRFHEMKLEGLKQKILYMEKMEQESLQLLKQ
ncbi:hypothetical protein [Salinicoccus roseus]